VSVLAVVELGAKLIPIQAPVDKRAVEGNLQVKEAFAVKIV
jgi:hypothetical protein